MSNDFGLIKQKLLIEYMLADETVFQRCRNILKPSYFDPEVTNIVDVMIKHADKYNVLPTVSQISAETDVLMDLVPNIRDQDQQWAMDNIEKFCQQGAVVKAVSDAFEYIESGDHGTIEIMIREAVLVGLQKDIGLNYFHDPRTRLERLKLKNLIPTGWRDIDRKLYGGLNRGELTIFPGVSGVGKSLFLQNICLNWVSGVKYSWRDDQEEKIYDPMNVLYITVELSQDLTSKRIDSMVTGINARDIFKRIDEVELKVITTGKKSGNFTIKYLPLGSNANDIRALVKEYEIIHGFIPDCIAVDYLDEMSPINNKIRMDNLYIKDQHITGDLRDIAVELDVVMVTASQLNRSAIDEPEQTQAMIGGGISKIQRADNVISIYQSAGMKERGEFLCTFLKTRSSAGVGSKVYLAFDVDSMRITDQVEGYINEDNNDEKLSGVELRNKIKQASNSDIISTIKRGPVKKTLPDYDPETGEIFENDKLTESHIDRLARLKKKGLI